MNKNRTAILAIGFALLTASYSHGQAASNDSKSLTPKTITLEELSKLAKFQLGKNKMTVKRDSLENESDLKRQHNYVLEFRGSDNKFNYFETRTLLLDGSNKTEDYYRISKTELPKLKYMGKEVSIEKDAPDEFGVTEKLSLTKRSPYTLLNKKILFEDAGSNGFSFASRRVGNEYLVTIAFNWKTKFDTVNYVTIELLHADLARQATQFNTDKLGSGSVTTQFKVPADKLGNCYVRAISHYASPGSLAYRSHCSPIIS